jgi:hypothetical protein
VCARAVGENGTDRRGPRVRGRGRASARAAPLGWTHRVEREKGERACAREGIGADRAGRLGRERHGRAGRERLVRAGSADRVDPPGRERKGGASVRARGGRR